MINYETSIDYTYNDNQDKENDTLSIWVEKSLETVFVTEKNVKDLERMTIDCEVVR